VGGKFSFSMIPGGEERLQKGKASRGGGKEDMRAPGHEILEPVLRKAQKGREKGTGKSFKKGGGGAGIPPPKHLASGEKGLDRGLIQCFTQMDSLEERKIPGIQGISQWRKKRGGTEKEECYSTAGEWQEGNLGKGGFLKTR